MKEEVKVYEVGGYQFKGVESIKWFQSPWRTNDETEEQDLDLFILRMIQLELGGITYLYSRMVLGMIESYAWKYNVVPKATKEETAVKAMEALQRVFDYCNSTYGYGRMV